MLCDNDEGEETMTPLWLYPYPMPFLKSLSLSFSSQMPFICSFCAEILLLNAFYLPLFKASHYQKNVYLLFRHSLLFKRISNFPTGICGFVTL